MNGCIYIFDSTSNQIRQLRDGDFLIVQPAMGFTTQFCGAAYGPDGPDVRFKEIDEADVYLDEI